MTGSRRGGRPAAGLRPSFAITRFDSCRTYRSVDSFSAALALRSRGAGLAKVKLAGDAPYLYEKV